jgi:hypothetical protein
MLLAEVDKRGAPMREADAGATALGRLPMTQIEAAIPLIRACGTKDAARARAWP